MAICAGELIMAKFNLVLPPTTKTSESLRSSGYNWIKAVADSGIDNAMDAFRKIDKRDLCPSERNFVLHVEGKKVTESPTQFTYIDNATGMDMETLQRAVQYGSKTERNDKDIGSFGLGLNTGTTAFGRTVTILTKTKDSDKVIKAVISLDLFELSGVYKYSFDDDVQGAELELFYERMSYVTDNVISGSTITVSSLDQLTAKIKDLRKSFFSDNGLKRIFGKSISKEINIFYKYNHFDAEELHSRGVPQTHQVFSKSEESPSGWNRLFNNNDDWVFRVLSPKDPRNSGGGESRRQGIDFFLNNRSLCDWRSINTHNIWRKDWKSSGVYVEIMYTADPKDLYHKNNGLVSLTFRKSDFDFSQSFNDKAKISINPWINKYIAWAAEKRAEGKGVDLEASKKLEAITNTMDAAAVNLSKSLNEDLKTESLRDTNNVTTLKTPKEPTTTPKKAIAVSRKDDEYEYNLAPGGKHNRAWFPPTWEQIGKRRKIKIVLNADHEWIKLRIIDSKDSYETIGAMECIVSHCVRELESDDSDKYDEFIHRYSMTLRDVSRSMSKVTFSSKKAV
jgi:hypothetical protein|tara:strand:- start:51 stop:1742 length:1692 start_codon:yes stop_codon:yes gene_type:complete